MARQVPGRPEASTPVMRIVPGQSETEASASTKATLPAAISALIRRPNVQAPMRSTISRRFSAAVVAGSRGGSIRTIETSERVSSESVTTTARGPAVALTPTSRGAGRGTVGPPPKSRLIRSTTSAGSASPTTITVILLGTYQRE